MSGTITCDECGLKMFAHGKLTEETRKLPKFDGWRKIVSEKVGNTVVSHFEDFCTPCAKKIGGCKR